MASSPWGDVAGLPVDDRLLVLPDTPTRLRQRRQAHTYLSDSTPALDGFLGHCVISTVLGISLAKVQLQALGESGFVYPF